MAGDWRNIRTPVRELVSILRVGGRVLIYVWALEQELHRIKSNYLKKSKVGNSVEESKQKEKKSIEEAHGATHTVKELKIDNSTAVSNERVEKPVVTDNLMDDPRLGDKMAKISAKGDVDVRTAESPSPAEYT